VVPPAHEIHFFPPEQRLPLDTVMVGWCSKPETHLIFNNVAEVIPFMVVFLHGAVLSDAPSSIMLGQMTIWTCRRCSFTSGTPCPIIITDGRFPPGNVGRLLYNDKVYRLSPLLSQDSNGEPSGAMRWMVSIIAWTQTALKSIFKFWTKPSLSVQASDASDLSMVGYMLEGLFGRSPFGATMQIRRLSSTGST
jgi:hypothetical protein